jgi:signal transduction histidine kinase
MFQNWTSAATAGVFALLPGLAFGLTLLAFMHRWERRLVLLALAMLTWTLTGDGSVHLWVRPSQLQTFELAMLATAGGALALLGLREAGLQHPGLDVLLPLQALLLPLVPMLGLPGEAMKLAPWLILATELGLVASWLLWMRRRPAGHGFSVWLDHMRTVGLPALLLVSVTAYALHRGWPQVPHAPGLTALLMVLQAVSLLVSYAGARHHLEAQLVQLEQRMHARVAEVERQQQQQAEQRLDQVTERERKRIAGDLHDDLGAKLLTIVHTSESERIATLAREALEEMRLSVRGLTGKPVYLMDAIGDWRAEVVMRLSQANIEADWLPLDDDLVHTLPSRTYVQTTRILREAISNTIKHSGATRCVVRCSTGDGFFQIIIQDNGRGIPIADGRLDRGHGMASMKSRAKQMQGQCLVESGAGWGTVIRLTIPL